MFYWCLIGVLHLLILSYQDIRHKKIVDSRHNWFMSGVTLSLISHYSNKLSYIFLLTITVLCLMYFIKKFKLMGEADVQTILWSFTGFGFICMWSLVWYIIVLMVLYLFQTIANIILCKYVLKKEITTFPAYPLFLVSFILSYLLFV